MNKRKVLNLDAFARFSWPSKFLHAILKRKSIVKSSFKFLTLLYFMPCIADESNNVILLFSGNAQVYQTVANGTIREFKKKCSFIKSISSDLKFENIVVGQEASSPIADALMLIVFRTKAASNSMTTYFNRQMIFSMIPKQGSFYLDNNSATLSRMLGNIDILLALPDTRINNSKTITSILTTSCRNHIPVVAFSSAYVKAGATVAVVTSLNDISQQVSDVAIKTLNNNSTGTQSMSADYFSVSINFDVARSLGIALRSPSEIKETMLKGKYK